MNEYHNVVLFNFPRIKYEFKRNRDMSNENSISHILMGVSRTRGQIAYSLTRVPSVIYEEQTLERT